jgi:PAS domain S-box-containing protein
MDKTKLEEYKQLVQEQGYALLDVLQAVAMGDLDVEAEVPEGVEVLSDLAIGINIMIDDLRATMAGQVRADLVEAQSQALLEVVQSVALGDLDVEVEVPEGIGVLSDLAIGLEMMIDDIREMLAEQEQARAEIERSQSQLEVALAEMRDIQRRYVREEWESHATEGQASQGYFRFGREEGPTDDAWLPGMTAAVQQAKSVIEREPQEEDSLALPIRLYDEVIGAVGFYREGEQPWRDHEIEAVETILEQVAQALEAQRLFDEEQQSRALLAEEQSLLRTLIDSIPDHVFVKDTQSRFLVNNETHLRTLGATTQEEVLGKTDFDIFPRELAEQYYADEQSVIQTGQRLDNREEPTITPEGKRLWLLTTKVPLRDRQGNLTGLVGISRDITVLKEAEAVLERRRAQLQCLSDIGQKIGDSPPVPEFLQWVAARIPSAMQHAELAVAAVEFEGQLSGSSEAIDSPRQMVQGLYLGGERVGRVCIAYTKDRDFLNEESALLGDIARRVNGYIENRRLLEETQAALAEVEAAHRTYLRRGWQEHLRQQEMLERSGLLYDQSAPDPQEGIVVVPDLWRPEIERAIVEGAPIPEVEEERAGLAVPITLRGQTLGVIGVEAPAGERQWTEEDMALIEAVSEQLGQTLETARLFADTQRRAERERLIGEITAKIRASTDMRNILETTAVELGQVLDTSRAIVRLGSPEDVGSQAGGALSSASDGDSS